MDRLDKIDKIRFFVADSENRALSSVWFMQGEGKGVYVAPSSLGSNLKLSFHPTGGSRDGCDCQFGHPRAFAEKASSRGFVPMRPLRWRRAATPLSGAVHVASIFFPSDRLMSASQPPPNAKIKFALQRAPAGMAVEAALFFSYENPSSLEKKFIASGLIPIAYSDFPGGEFVSLAVRHTETPDIPEIEKIDDGYVLLQDEDQSDRIVNARAVVASDVPNAGDIFRLAEIGPLLLKRKKR